MKPQLSRPSLTDDSVGSVADRRSGVGSSPSSEPPSSGSASTAAAVAVKELQDNEIQSLTDAQLIASVREGDITMYGELYARHVVAAYSLARKLARSAVEADDLVSESFSRVLSTLRASGGPDSTFRAYLLTALRHVAYDKTRKERKLELTEDVETIANPVLISVTDDDAVTAGFEKSIAARAFSRLPERWQTVLWLTEVDGKAPAEVAPALGLTANGVSALAYRAREGLRQAYLQAHLAEAAVAGCQPTFERLGAWTRNGLSKREAGQVCAHLARCGSCRDLSVELVEINTAAFNIHAVAAPAHRGRAKEHRHAKKRQTPLARRCGSGSAVKLAS